MLHLHTCTVHVHIIVRMSMLTVTSDSSLVMKKLEQMEAAIAELKHQLKSVSDIPPLWILALSGLYYPDDYCSDILQYFYGGNSTLAARGYYTYYDVRSQKKNYMGCTF